MVTRVPTGDRKGWDTVDSTTALTGALVTAPSATGALSTRTGSAPAGAMVKVPEALTPGWGEAPAGSVRPAGIPQLGQRQLQRCRAGSRDKQGLDRGQPTPGKFRLHSIARDGRTGSDTYAGAGRRLGSGTARPGPASRPRGPAGSNSCSAARRFLSRAPTCAGSARRLSLGSAAAELV